ncbi:MAG: hypothetical protein QG650_559 [Patescibacteria group bacterium]|nr:hypothetical protein [Patescibacteria group bacterium]
MESGAVQIPPGDDIFQGLGENFFAEAQSAQAVKAKKKDPYEVGAKAFDIGMKLAIVATIVFCIDSSIRSMETPEYFENLPVCDYLSWGIHGFENGDCNTVVQIAAKKTEELAQIETTVTNNLIVLVPKRLESSDALNSPEVQFIKEHTGDTRASFQNVIEGFQEIVAGSDYRGEDIECSKFVFNEKGEFSTSCEFYGGPLDSASSKESRSSRMTALAFLARVEGSEFRLLNSPKSLDIAKYTSADPGIRSTFSTLTRLQLNFRYVPANGNRP